MLSPETSRNEILPTENLESIFEQKSILPAKPVLENMLRDGMIIRDKRSYNALRGLMMKYFQLRLCNYDDIKEGYGGPSTDLGASKKNQGFILAWDGGKKIMIHPDDGPISGQSGYIEEGRFFQQTLPPISLNYSANDTLFEAPREKPKPPEAPQSKPYKIKPKDTLWGIVKKWYGLTDPNDIANAINVLVKENNNIKGIRKDIPPKDRILGDVIREGNILILPVEISFLRKIPRNRTVKRVDTIEK